jgi:hypothetical protein
LTVATVTIERPAILGRGDQLRLGAAPPDRMRPAGGEPTLDDVLVSAWNELGAHRTVSCPVCHGAMAPRYGSEPQPVGGRCRDCDSTLG